MAADLSDFVHHLRGAVRGDHLARATDGELLARYATDRDDLAFAELVHRHAPAVYAQCRRHLSDVDDAFQATFVVLARKTGTLTHPERLCSWLCGVADRIARKAQARNAKRGSTERAMDTTDEPTTTDPTSDADLRAVLDQELHALPPDLRQLVLLCDVDGVSRRAAAKQLGIPVGTLSNRLTRARAMLGSRLLRRGIALGAGLTLTSVSTATVPAKLVSLTVSRITSATIPPELLSLASEGVPSMPRIRFVLALLVGVLAIGIGAVSSPAKAPVKQPPTKPAEPPLDPITNMRSGVGTMQMAPNGRLLATGGKEDGDKTGPGVTLMDPVAGGVVRKLMVPKDRQGGFRYFRFTPDGKNLLAAAGRGGDVFRWEVESGKLLNTFDTFDEASIGVIAVSPDGQRVVTTHHDVRIDVKGMESLRVRDATTGKQLLCYEPPEGWRVQQMAFAPTGCGLWVSFFPMEGGAGYLAELCGGCGTELRRITPKAVSVGGTPSLGSFAVTADDKYLIVGGGDSVPQPGGGSKCAGNLSVYDLKSGELLKTLDQDRGDWIDFALSADGKRLFAWTQTGETRWRVRNGQKFGSGVGEVACYDAGTWKRLWAVERDYGLNLYATPTPDGKRLFVSDGDGLWHLDANTGEQLPGQYARFK